MPLPLILGLLSAAGSVAASGVNALSANKQMKFQERMSSTSAQRAVKDYQAAGLNPALAYDRGASSPGGASVTVGDPISSGIATASQARQLNTQLKIAQDQSTADLQLKREQAKASLASASRDLSAGNLSEMQSRLTAQTIGQNLLTNPLDLQSRRIQNTINSLLIPGAENKAAFEKMMGKFSPGISKAGEAANLIKLFKY